MHIPRTLLSGLIALCVLLGGAVFITGQSGNTAAASPSLAPNETPTPPPDCGDWRLWPSPTSDQLINPLYGVAAAAPDDVWAVGFRGGYGSTHPHVLIEHWDGTEWTLMPADNPGILHAVAVVAPDDVWAVGYYSDPALTLTMHWDGTAWAVVPSPSETGVSNNLYGVAATASGDVWAVGNARNQSRVLHWSGGQWNIVPTPELEYSFLNAVAIAGPNDVWAVGTRGAYSYFTYTMHWNGTFWSEVASPSPGTYENSLQSISVVAPDNIWAAGWSSNGGSVYSPTILRWDGSQWNVSPVSVGGSPQTTSSTQLFGITAVSSSDAWAVGWGYDWTIRRNIVAKWNGTSWTQVTVPDASGYFNELFAVTSVGPGEAWAVGYLGGAGSYYVPQILRNGPICGTPTPTVTGTPPTATDSPTVTPTSTATDVPPTATAIPTVCGVLLSEGFEGGALGAFRSVVTVCQPGGCDWRSSTISPHTGLRDAFAPDLEDITDQRLTLTTTVVPLPGSLLTFWHSYDFEGVNESYFDGGVLEGSTNGGATWFDMGDDIVSGGYVGTISPFFDNPLAGREAWGQNSGGYIQTVVNLSPYAGQSFLFRFREGTDSSLGANGWRIDDILVTGGGVCGTATVTAIASTTAGVTATATGVTSQTAVPTDTSVPPTSTPISEESQTPTPLATVGACNITFTDLQPENTFYETVMCLACNGIMNGYADGTIRLNNEVTRGQVAKLVSNAAGFNDAVQPNSQSFEDVPVGSTFYIYVERVATRGVIAGYPCGGEGEPCGADNEPYFRPFANATRGQISKIVANAAQMSDIPSEQMFQDVDAGNAFYLPIERLALHGMMSGYPCGGANEPCGPDNRPYFRPAVQASRGQSAKIIANTFFSDCRESPNP